MTEKSPNTFPNTKINGRELRQSHKKVQVMCSSCKVPDNLFSRIPNYVMLFPLDVKNSVTKNKMILNTCRCKKNKNSQNSTYSKHNPILKPA